MHDELLFAERALHAGASGYVSKQAANENIVDSIHQVLAGKIVVSDQVNERMLVRIAKSGSNLHQDPVGSLSNRELEVFECIGKGLSTRQIAKRFNRSPKTIETHRERIKKKLGLNTAYSLIRRATQWVENGS